MVPDGMSVAAATLARFMQPDNPNDPEEDWTFTGERRLAMDDHIQGLVRTAWAGGPITDSAPAATAMATGHTSNNMRIGLDRNDDPRATVMQAAQTLGMSTGVVMTSEFMHATPAAFLAHDVARFNYESLARQMLANRPNVVLGTGSAQVRSFNVHRRGLPEGLTDADVWNDNGYLRRNSDNLRVVDPQGYTLDSRRSRIITENTWMQNVSSEGYQIVRTRTQMNRLLRPTSSNAQDLRVWGDFNGGLTMLGENYRFLSYDIDRQHRPDLDEPSLADMTRVAIDLLSSNRNGFMLVVEGSKVDWAAHAHDAVALMGDVLAFDRAFQVALDFAKRCGNTIVIVASDHSTGGLAIGSSDLSFDAGQEQAGNAPWTFDEAPWEFLYPLRRAVTQGGRSSESAIQHFVLGRKQVVHPSSPNPIDWSSNHNQVLALYGIDYDFYDTLMLLSTEDLNALDGYLRETHRTTPNQVRRVHQLIENFRTAHSIEVVSDQPGQEHLRGNGMAFLSTANLQNARRMLGAIMNQISYITFSNDWHTGEDVPFYMFAPRGFSHQELLNRNTNHINNTDIAVIIANALQVCLETLTDRLFVEVFNNGESMIPGVEVTITDARFQSNLTREGNPDVNNSSGWVEVDFKITRGSQVITLTSNMGHFYRDETRMDFDFGVNLYIITKPQFQQTSPFGGINQNTGRLFVPRELLEVLR